MKGYSHRKAVREYWNLISQQLVINIGQNVLAVCAMATELGIKPEIFKMALEGFQGVNRRFSLLSSFRGINIYDDYGHHPVEIRGNIISRQAGI